MSVANSLNIMILNDFSEVERAMSEIEQSAGSANKEMEIIEESLDYKINALKETWTGIFQNLIDRGTIGGIIDFLTTLSELIEKLTSNSTALSVVLSGIVGTITQIKFDKEFNWIDIFKSIGTSAVEAGKGIGNFINELGKMATFNPAITATFESPIDPRVLRIEEIKNELEQLGVETATVTEEVTETITENITEDITEAIAENTTENVTEAIADAVIGTDEIGAEAGEKLAEGIVDGVQNVFEDEEPFLSQEELKRFLELIDPEHLDEVLDSESLQIAKDMLTGEESIFSPEDLSKSMESNLDEALEEYIDYQSRAGDRIAEENSIFSPEDLSELSGLSGLSETMSEESKEAYEELKDYVSDYNDRLAEQAETKAEHIAALQKEQQALEQELATEEQSIGTKEALTAAEQQENAALMQQVMADEQLTAGEMELLTAESNRLAMLVGENAEEAKQILEKGENITVTDRARLATLQEAASKEALTTETMKAVVAMLEEKLAHEGTLSAREAEILGIYKKIGALKAEEVQTVKTSKAMMILKSVSSMLVTSAIIWGITKVIELLGDWLQREEKLIDAGKKARDEIDNLQSSFQNLKKSTEGIEERYAELAQGVKNLGTAFQSQGSLSNEEYEEFLDLSTQLSKLYPQLTKGYDDNGQAILDLSGDVDTIVSSLNEYVKTAKELANIEIWGKSDDLWAGLQAQTNQMEKSVKTNEEYLEELEFMWNGINTNRSFSLDSSSKKQGAFIRKFFDRAGVTNSVRLTPDDMFGYDFSNLTEEQIEDLHRAYEQLKSELEKENNRLKKEITSKFSDTHDIIFSWLESQSEDYEKIGAIYGDDGQKIIKELLNNIDPDVLVDNIKNMSKDEFVGWLDEMYLQPLLDLEDEEKNLILKGMTAEGSLGNLQNLYKEIIDYLMSQDGFSADDPLYLYFAGKLADTGKDIDKAYDKIVGDTYLQGNPKEVVRNWIKELSEEDYNLVMNTEIDPEGTTEQALDKWLEDLQEKANSKPIKVSTISESVKQFNEELKPQFDALASAYQQIFYNEKGFQEGLKSVDIAWFENIRSNFEEIKEDLNITFDSKNVDTFFRALENGEKITEELAHDAFNDLATVYFHSAEGLKNLNKETENSIKQMMKQMGITNTDEVINRVNGVQSRLETLLDFNAGLEEEYQKIKDYGLEDYEQQIKNKTIQSKYGNVDMDKRTVIEWNKQYLNQWEEALKSWTYFDDYGNLIGSKYDEVKEAIEEGQHSIDTVYGGSEAFQLNDQEIEVAFTPIMVDENGENPQFLDYNTCAEYIQNILEMADKAVEDSGQEWTEEAVFEKAIELDARGMYVQGEDGGREFVRGLIAGIGENAVDIGSLLHFSGEEGAIQLQEKAIEEYNNVVDELAKKGKEIEDITEADIAVLQSEKVVTELTAAQLKEYADMKALANGTLLEEGAAVSSLYALADAAGIAAAEVNTLNEIMALFDQAASLEAQGAYTASNEVRNAAEAKMRNFEQLVQEKYQELKFEVPDTSKSGGGSSEEEDRIKNQLDVLKWLYDNDVIDYKHYLDQKKLLLDRALAEGLIDNKRYFEEIHTWLRETLELYNSVISYATKLLDKEIDRLEKERDERIKSIEEQRDAELKAIDDEIEAQEKKIKAKQKEIEELQKANEARKQAIDLQKAEYELQRSLNQRTNLVEILCQAS